MQCKKKWIDLSQIFMPFKDFIIQIIIPALMMFGIVFLLQKDYNNYIHYERDDILTCYYILIFVIYSIFLNLLSYLTGRRLSYLISGSLIIFFNIINFFVLTFTGDLLTYNKLFAISEALTVAKNYSLSSNDWIILSISLILTIGFYIYIIKVIPKERLEKQFIYKTIILTFLIIIAFNCGSYVKEIVNYMPVNAELYFITTIKKYDDIKDVSDIDFYNDDTVHADTDERPNVIIIMNESFSDLSVNAPLKDKENVLKNTKQIMQESIYSGYVNSSIYGGGTVSSEFEAITGISTGFVDSGEVIYAEYFNEYIPSVANVFNSLDYKTFYIHPNDDYFYNRDDVIPSFGFKECIYKNDFKNPVEYYNNISDQDCYQKLTDIDKETEESYFVFLTTIQNHGGFTETNELGLDDKVENTYLTLLQESDEALQSLIDYYKTSPKETYIIFFGDHQPNLEAYKERVFSENKDANEQSFYKTPYFIWTNKEGKTSTVQDTSINYLSAILMHELGIHTNWFDTIYKLQEKYPVISKKVFLYNNEMYFGQTDEVVKSIEDSRLLDYQNMCKIYVYKKGKYDE